ASVRNGVGLPQKEQKVNNNDGGMPKTLLQKLEILADAAKYDASCASSGGAGICHAYTPDGRCVSLLKILLTNFCRYDCAYCVSRRSSNVERARFTVAELSSSRSISTGATASRDCSCRPASLATRTTPWGPGAGGEGAAHRARLS